MTDTSIDDLSGEQLVEAVVVEVCGAVESSKIDLVQERTWRMPDKTMWRKAYYHPDRDIAQAIAAAEYLQATRDVYWYIDRDARSEGCDVTCIVSDSFNDNRAEVTIRKAGGIEDIAAALSRACVAYVRAVKAKDGEQCAP